MKIEMIGTEFPRIELEDIYELQETLGILFPEDYISFLLEQNGGYPQKAQFSLLDGSDTSLVNLFYPISKEGVNLYQRNRFLDYGEQFITIGDDPGGNQILLGVGDENKGAIYFWDHEDEGEESMHFLANSLTEFLNMLQE